MRRITYIEYQLPRWWVPWEWAAWVRMKRLRRHYQNRLQSASVKILLMPRDTDAVSAAKARQIENFFYRLYDELNNDRPRA